MPHVEFVGPAPTQRANTNGQTSLIRLPKYESEHRGPDSAALRVWSHVEVLQAEHVPGGLHRHEADPLIPYDHVASELRHKASAQALPRANNVKATNSLKALPHRSRSHRG